jgi:hypothetical protein
MNKTKFTPGPWKIGTPPPNGEQTIGTEQGLMVAVSTTGAGIQTKANAHLIAAAPDLYEALEDLSINDFGSNGWTNSMERIAIKARAALAKARGEA